MHQTPVHLAELYSPLNPPPPPTRAQGSKRLHKTLSELLVAWWLIGWRRALKGAVSGPKFDLGCSIQVFLA